MLRGMGDRKGCAMWDRFWERLQRAAALGEETILIEYVGSFRFENCDLLELGKDLRGINCNKP